MLKLPKCMLTYLLIVTSLNADVKVADQIQSFPVVSVNMAGEGYKILVGGEIKKIKIDFKNEIDCNSFFNIKPEILFNSVNSLNTSPKLYLVGKVIKNDIFLAESWFLLSPYYEVNSLVEGEYDVNKTKKRTTLTAFDFNKIWDINNADKAKLVAPRKRPNNINWNKYLKRLEK